MNLKGNKITWLGHATFLFETSTHKKVLVDPWLAGNPKCPKSFHAIDVDATLITHGHGDHLGDLLTYHPHCHGPIVGIYDLTSWLGHKGVPSEKLMGMNKGGSVALPGLDVTVAMTNAHHSSSWMDDDGTIVYLGEPAGYVLNFANSLRVYVAGDTCLFGDMKLIGELYQPDLAILPIGDRFTMDPKAAAVACRLLNVKAAIPSHYGTFPLLTGTPEQFKAALGQQGLSVELLTCDIGTPLA